MRIRTYGEPSREATVVKLASRLHKSEKSGYYKIAEVEVIDTLRRHVKMHPQRTAL